MHEVGLASAVVEHVLVKAAGRRVLGAGVRVGASHRIAVDSLVFGFDHQTAGTIAEGADLEVEVVPAHLHCGECDARVEVVDVANACPACHGIDVTVETEDELTLLWVRYEA